VPVALADEVGYRGGEANPDGTNLIDIASRHYFNIIVKTATDGTFSSFISDAIGTGNYPNLLNKKVQVKVITSGEAELIIGPAPTSPTPNRVAPGVLNASHEPSARQWVRDDHAGMVFSVKVAIPSLEDRKTVKAECFIKIYDAIGNQVWSIKNKDITESLLKNSRNADSSVVDFDTYWNVYNSNGMKVAPGIYKVILYINYSGLNAEKYPNIKVTGKAGVELGNSGLKIRKY
jgi:hypothetical protein